MTRIYSLLVFALFAVLQAAAQPRMVFEQTTLELGTLLWHTPRTATFRFVNKGTGELVIRDVHTDCGCTSAEWTESAVAPGAAGEIAVTYDAEMLGRFHKGLAVYTNLADEPIYLNIMGQVALTQTEPSVDYPYQIGDYFLSTDDVEFDNVNRGDLPTFVLHLYNSSKKSYRPELMHLPKYLAAEADPAVIRPGRTGRIILTLESRELSNMGLTQTSIYLSRFPGDRVNKATEINVSATLLPDFLDTPTQHALSPTLEIDSTRITLSKPNKRGRADGQLVLRNSGKTPLVISALQVYNPGLNVSIGKRRIDLGESVKLKITTNVNNNFFKGRRRILLITNDPDRPKTVIDVTVEK